MEKLYRLIKHPSVDIFIAIILIVSSLAEGWEMFSVNLSEFDLGVHHGIMALGISMLLRGIIEALEASKRLKKGTK